MHTLSCTQRCFQCTIVHTKIVYSCRRALEQIYQQKPFARLYTKYREEPTVNVLCRLSLHLICYFLKQYHVSRSNIGFLCPSYILCFERAPCMCFCFGCDRVVHFRTISKICMMPELKEHYT